MSDYTAVNEADYNVLNAFEKDIENTKKKLEILERDLKIRDAFNALKSNKNFKTVIVDGYFGSHNKKLWDEYYVALNNGYSDTKDFKESRIELIKNIEALKKYFRSFEEDLYYKKLEDNIASCNETLETLNKKYVEYFENSKVIEDTENA